VGRSSCPPAPPEAPDTARSEPSGTAPGEGAAPHGSSVAPAHEAPAPAGRPAEPATPPAESTPPAPAPAAGFGFGFAQRLLDAGTIDRAAETFSRALRPMPRDRYTLQMMIACEAETVRKARAGTRPDEGLFVLPIAVRGRGCYRVLWGVFESRDAASGAAIPPYFASSGVTPAVVAIDRLRPPV
jgi:septal ring-binding cell division protein DamX